jgi:hypothetical protein
MWISVAAESESGRQMAAAIRAKKSSDVRGIGWVFEVNVFWDWGESILYI